MIYRLEVAEGWSESIRSLSCCSLEEMLLAKVSFLDLVPVSCKKYFRLIEDEAFGFLPRPTLINPRACPYVDF
jgi:hypothetical protein